MDPRRRAHGRVAPVGALAGALAVLAGLLLAVLAAPATPALAHATQLATDPAAGSVVPDLPKEITVRFSETVQAVPARTSVTAPDGTRADTGPARASGDTLRIAVRSAAPRGTYLVSYRVISADGHPVGGGFTFSVGAPSATAPKAPASGDAPVDPVVLTVLAVTRFLGLLAVALLTGVAVVLAGLWPRRLPRTGPARLARWSLGALAVVTLAELYVQAPHTSGATLFGASADDLRAVLDSHFGQAHLVRLAVLAAAAFPLRALLRGTAGRADRVLLLLLAVVGALTWSFSGHPGTGVVTAVADAAHLGAMAYWLGGLVMLVVFLLPRGNRRELSAIMPVWSRRATIAVAVLAVAGLTQAVVQVGSLPALVDTGYGQLVLAKSALFAAVLGVAFLSRRMVLAGSAAGGGGAPHRAAADPGAPAAADPGTGTDPDAGAAPEAATGPAGGTVTVTVPADVDTGPPAGRLRRSVLVEIGIVAVVLALTAALVQTTPGRTSQAAREAAAGPPSYTLASQLYSLQVELDPGGTGENTLHLYAYTPVGAPIAIKEWRVTAGMPAAGVEPLPVSMLPISDNHAVGEVSLPRAGAWEFRFTLRTTDIDEASVVQVITVR